MNKIHHEIFSTNRIYPKVWNRVPSRIVSRLKYSPHQKLELLIQSSLEQSPHSNNIPKNGKITLINITKLPCKAVRTYHLVYRSVCFYVQNTKYADFQQNISTDINCGIRKIKQNPHSNTVPTRIESRQKFQILNRVRTLFQTLRYIKITIKEFISPNFSKTIKKL